jgi:hypothetical protein
VGHERPLRPALQFFRTEDADDEERTATKQTPTADMCWTAKKRRFLIVLPRHKQSFRAAENRRGFGRKLTSVGWTEGRAVVLWYGREILAHAVSSGSRRSRM